MAKTEYEGNPPAAGPSDSPGQQGNTMALGKDEEERREDRMMGSVRPVDPALQKGTESEPDPDERGPDSPSKAPSANT
jgi:hypothetical protein